MTNRYIPLRDANDPIPAVVARRLPEAVNQRLTERLNRDEVRTPMQWAPGPGAGFCPPGVEPWLPIGDDAATVNVHTETGDPASLLEWYRTLLALRRAEPALGEGSLRLVPAESSIIAFERMVDGTTLLVLANLGEDAAGHPLHAGDEIVVATGDDVEVRDAILGSHASLRVPRLEMPPHSAAVVRLASP